RDGRPGGRADGQVQKILVGHARQSLDLRYHLVRPPFVIEAIDIVAADHGPQRASHRREDESELGDLFAVDFDPRYGYVDLDVGVRVEELAGLRGCGRQLARLFVEFAVRDVGDDDHFHVVIAAARERLRKHGKQLHAGNFGNGGVSRADKFLRADIALV